MDKYSIIKKIGQGSFGNVWLVREKQQRRLYVLKRINLKNSNKRKLKAAFLEVQLLSSLNHPNIVSYHEAFKVEEGILCIFMTYCDGGDIYAKIKSQNGIYFQEVQIVRWFIQICIALQYLHERNILHRDLKTQNIFLTKLNVIKLGDLGIAKVLDDEHSMATTLIGTPYYMSPELFSNKPYSYKSDIWALGCCVYEIVSLRHAFRARNIESLSYKILRGKMPPMPSHFSSEFLDLIKNMLNLDPGKRPTLARMLHHSCIEKHVNSTLENVQSEERKLTNNPVLTTELKPNELYLEGQGLAKNLQDNLIFKNNSPRLKGNESVKFNKRITESEKRNLQLMVSGQEIKLGNKNCESEQKNLNSISENAEKLNINKLSIKQLP